MTRATRAPAPAVSVSIWLAIWLAGAAGAVRPAWAAPEATLATQAAQAHYEAGSVYYEKGEYRRAADEFLAAQRDDDQPALDYNLGVCWEKLGDAVAAQNAYRRFVARQPTNDRRAEIEARIAALDASIGELVIHTTVASARVTVDEVKVEPQGPLRVNAGRRRVSAAKEGYLPRSVEIVVVAGARSEVSVDPAAPPRRSRKGLVIGLGVAGGVVLVGTAVAVGVVLGMRGFQPHDTDLGTITVGR